AVQRAEPAHPGPPVLVLHDREDHLPVGGERGVQDLRRGSGGGDGVLPGAVRAPHVQGVPGPAGTVLPAAGGQGDGGAVTARGDPVPVVAVLLGRPPDVVLPSAPGRFGGEQVEAAGGVGREPVGAAEQHDVVGDQGGPACGLRTGPAVAAFALLPGDVAFVQHVLGQV